MVMRSTAVIILTGGGFVYGGGVCGGVDTMIALRFGGGVESATAALESDSAAAVGVVSVISS